MIQRVDAPVSVISKYDHRKGLSMVVKLLWEGKEYKIIKTGYAFKRKEGSKLLHVYNVECKTLSFQLVLDTSNQSWRVERISDGESD